MATYLENVTDSGSNAFQTRPFTPDVSFWMQGLQRKDQQYQQGLQEVGQGYSAILNTPLTNSENLDKRKEYAKTAMDGLQKLAPTDLSLSKNVRQAESLYAPFWQDDDLLIDSHYTKNATSQLQQADGDRQSKDEKIKTTYNPYSVARIQYGLQDLKNAKRGDGSIGRVESAEYVPITDYQQYTNEEDKSLGFKGISKQTVNGPSLITEVNGVGALPQLTTRYDGMLGSKFQAQFSQQGWVEHRQQLDALSRQYPNISRQDLNKKLAEDKYHEVLNLHENRVQNMSNDLYTTFQMPIKALYDLKQAQGGKLTPEQQNNLDRLENGYTNDKGVQVPGQAQYEQLLSRASTERDNFVRGNPQEKIGIIADNPEQYYAQTARQATIDKLAAVQASNYSYTIGANEIWDKVATHRENEARVQLERKTVQEKIRNDELEHQDRKATNDKDYYKINVENGINLSTGERTTNPATGIVNTDDVLGGTTTDQQHIDFANVLNAQKNQYLNTVAGASFGVNGTSQRLIDLPGMDANTLLQYNTQMQRLFTGNNYTDPNFSQKPEEKKAFQKVRSILSKYLGREIPSNYNEVAKAQNEFIAIELKRRSTDLKVPMDKNDPYNQAYGQMTIAKDALNGYLGKVNEEQTALTHLTLADKNTHHILLNDAGTRVAGVSDMVKYAPELEVHDQNGNHKVISREEYAEAFSNKKLKHSSGTELNINGHRYTIDKVNGQDNINDEYRETLGASNTTESEIALAKMTGRFGDYEQRDNLNSSLQNKVGSSMSSVTDKTGKTGTTVSYGFGNEKSPGNGERLIMEAVDAANNTGINFQGSKDNLSETDITKLKGKLGSYSDIRKNAGQPAYSTVSSTGQDVARFVVKDWDGNGNSKIVEVPLSPHPTGQFLTSVPKSSGLYVYSQLQRGKIINSDNVDESMGYKYTVSPDNADNPNYAKVSTQHLKVDMRTGKESWVPDAPLNIQMTGNYNPDQIMEAVSKRGADYRAKLTAQRKEFNSKHAN